MHDSVWIGQHCKLFLNDTVIITFLVLRFVLQLVSVVLDDDHPLSVRMDGRHLLMEEVCQLLIGSLLAMVGCYETMQVH